MPSEMHPNESRKCIRSLQKSLDSIKAQLESISEQSKANASHNEPCPPKTINSVVSLPPSIPSYYDAENNERPSKRTWERIARGIEFGGLLAVVAYVIVTACTLNEIKRQTNAATNAAQAARDQLKVMRSGQRPWLGISGPIQLIGTPKFRTWYPYPNRTDTSAAAVAIDGVFIIHNFGTSPAFYTTSFIDVQIPIGDTTTRPKEAETFDCESLADRKLDSGEVVFPGSGFSAPFSSQSGRTIPGEKIREIRRLWLVGCILYNDGDSHTHRTKFWFRSDFPDAAPWIQLTPEFRHMPISGFESWGEEAN